VSVETDVLVSRELGEARRYREASRETVQVGVSVPATTYEYLEAGEARYVCRCPDLGVVARADTPDEALAAVRDELLKRLRSVGLS